jgi:2-methylisocitrate lyase-like PEP mutase family enzyme
MTAVERAQLLRQLHTDPDLLVLANVWDVASATTVAAAPGCRAIATASHAIAAAFGYPDGENIPVATMLDMVGRIAAAVDLPVTADLEAGYGDPGETVRKAIALGVVGANIEDQMRPLAESVKAVEAVVKAAGEEGVPFVLNARTDAFVHPGSRDHGEVVAEAIARGRAFLDAGATCVFAPGRLDAETIGALVEGIGDRKVSVIGIPGTPSQSELAALGVARVSFGPRLQMLAMGALAGAATQLFSGGSLPG